MLFFLLFIVLLRALWSFNIKNNIKILKVVSAWEATGISGDACGASQWSKLSFFRVVGNAVTSFFFRCGVCRQRLDYFLSVNLFFLFSFSLPPSNYKSVLFIFYFSASVLFPFLLIYNFGIFFVKVLFLFNFNF